MSSAICTLFESHYHFGLAGLSNSLYQNGFRGDIYAGYKGELPNWAAAAKENTVLGWKGGKTLEVTEGLVVHFLPIETDYHLTNYKPDFMLRLWNGPAANKHNMFYFDPDIVVVRPWELFDEWVTCGIALCEDVNSPLCKQHPRRVAWRRFFKEKSIQLNFKNSIYVNGGFIGLSKDNIEFLELWKTTQETMAPMIGGLNVSIFDDNHVKLLEQSGGAFMPFSKTDQDALNIAIEVFDEDISYMGKEGMGFDNGYILMYHALGSPKPWQWKPLKQCIDGRAPRRVDIEYWKSAHGPIKAIKNYQISLQIIVMKFTTGVARFYSRN